MAETIEPFYGLVGKSTAIKHVCALLERIAPFEVPVLIEGESGTGKELVARAVHYNSPRKDNEFVIINCSAFSDHLLESELFGHMRGSFTGAIAEKKGLFEVADKGTFFLDEIGDMSAALQVKLLRVLQEGIFLKIGGVAPVHVDVRIIAATNKNLKQMIDEKRFREDLYYRLNVMHIVLPPLRDREEDIPLLIEYISQKIAAKNEQAVKKISQETMKYFQKYQWPGNVRELENELEKAYIISDGDTITPNHLSNNLVQQVKKIGDSSGSSALLKKKRKALVSDFERRMIEEALLRTKGNQTKAAKSLGISRQNLSKKLKNLKIDI